MNIMDMLFDGLGMFIRIRLAWDGLHIDVNLILLLAAFVVYTWYHFLWWSAGQWDYVPGEELPHHWRGIQITPRKPREQDGYSPD